MSTWIILLTNVTDDCIPSRVSAPRIWIISWSTVSCIETILLFQRLREGIGGDEDYRPQSSHTAHWAQESKSFQRSRERVELCRVTAGREKTQTEQLVRGAHLHPSDEERRIRKFARAVFSASLFQVSPSPHGDWELVAEAANWTSSQMTYEYRRTQGCSRSQTVKEREIHQWIWNLRKYVYPEHSRVASLLSSSSSLHPIATYGKNDTCNHSLTSLWEDAQVKLSPTQASCMILSLCSGCFSDQPSYILRITNDVPPHPIVKQFSKWNCIWYRNKADIGLFPLETCISPNNKIH